MVCGMTWLRTAVLWQPFYSRAARSRLQRVRFGAKDFFSPLSRLLF